MFGGKIKLRNMKIRLEDGALKFVYLVEDDKQSRKVIGWIEKSKSDQWSYNILGSAVFVVYTPLTAENYEVFLASIERLFRKVVS